MSWKGVTEGDYGWVGRITIVQDGTAQDISTYTTLQYLLTSPSKVETTKTASFDTDGSDGVLAYTFQDGDIDEEGRWLVRPRIAKTGVELTGELLTFTVRER